MSMNARKFQRDGLGQYIKFAKMVCRIHSAFAPTIRQKWGDEPLILALLTAGEALCAALVAADPVYDAARAGGLNADIVEPPTVNP